MPQDIFRPVKGTRPSNIPTRPDHPIPTSGVTHPYSVVWCKERGIAKSFGLAISHFDDDQKALVKPPPPPKNISGYPTIAGDPAKYFYCSNEDNGWSIILSGVITSGAGLTGLGSDTVLTTDTLKAFSVNVNLQSSVGSRQSITFPLVQASASKALGPRLIPKVVSNFKYRVALVDDKAPVQKSFAQKPSEQHWLVYVTPDDRSDPNIHYNSETLSYIGPKGFNSIIQVAKNPFGSPEPIMYDNAAGAYPVDALVRGSVQEVDARSGRVSQRQYSIIWIKMGLPSTILLMFALPHHVESFEKATKDQKTEFQLATTIKGKATAVVADSWTMIEPDLPAKMDFAPWSPTAGIISTLSISAVTAIQSVAAAEAREDMDGLIEALGRVPNTWNPGMYFSGKRASKFAAVVYTIHDLLNDPVLAAETLTKLKLAIARFLNNTQLFPLVYESAYRGVVSSASYTEPDLYADFGNSVYNDHHFHYGYWIHAAAMIGYFDPVWADIHKDWVNMLVKDARNPVSDEEYPFSRCFDWYHGHSWARGVTPAPDGKDEESTSEEGLFAYAIKTWGKVIGDKSMEKRGNLMLAVLARTFSNYFLMEKLNTNQPPGFIGNKVTGILYENKCDHWIWFWDWASSHKPIPEAIQGIHMLPINPSSAFTRTAKFVEEGWDVYFGKHGALPIDNIDNGWKGIIMANLAIYNPHESWKVFNRPDFKSYWLDDGASRTWYMAYAACLGRAPAESIPLAVETETKAKPLVENDKGTPVVENEETTPVPVTEKRMHHQ